jgi:hypothetical protein
MANQASHGLRRVAPAAVPPEPGRIAAAVGAMHTAARDFAPAIRATSLSIEDMALADMLWRDGLILQARSCKP